MAFFYKCLNNLTDLIVKEVLSFARHGNTRLSSSNCLKHPYVKQAPIRRATLTALLNSGTTSVICRCLQISPLRNPSRTLFHLMHLGTLLMSCTMGPCILFVPALRVFLLCATVVCVFQSK